MKILTQVYSTTVRSYMEYASNAWSSAARTNLVQLTKAQTTGLRIIPDGMKTTPNLRGGEDSGPAVVRGKEKLRQSEKMKSLPSHPLHSKFEAPIKYRLKRPNHLVKTPQKKHRIPLFARNQPLEMLQKYEDGQAETPTIILDIPGIQPKENHTDKELRSLTPETFCVAYPSTTWARAYTDGSA